MSLLTGDAAGRLHSAVLLTLAAVALGGCAGSSSGVPTPPPPTPLVYTPTANPPPANSISLQLGSITSTTVTLDIVATDVTNISSVFFDLVFSTAVIVWSDARPGGFLGGASVQFLTTPDAAQPGHLIVGIAFVPDTMSATGTGLLGSFTFRKVGPGTTGISFERSGALQPGGADVPGLSFTGGTVTAR